MDRLLGFDCLSVRIVGRISIAAARAASVASRRGSARLLHRSIGRGIDRGIRFRHRAWLRIARHRSDLSGL
jgi:hypothetical protein